jgi:hypothetical protein
MFVLEKLTSKKIALEKFASRKKMLGKKLLTQLVLKFVLENLTLKISFENSSNKGLF